MQEKQRKYSWKMSHKVSAVKTSSQLRKDLDLDFDWTLLIPLLSSSSGSSTQLEVAQPGFGLGLVFNPFIGGR